MFSIIPNGLGYREFVLLKDGQGVHLRKAASSLPWGRWRVCWIPCAAIGTDPWTLALNRGGGTPCAQ